jgi:hypothetical protein
MSKKDGKADLTPNAIQALKLVRDAVRRKRKETNRARYKRRYGNHGRCNC